MKEAKMDKKTMKETAEYVMKEYMDGNPIILRKDGLFFSPGLCKTEDGHTVVHVGCIKYEENKPTLVELFTFDNRSVYSDGED